MLGDLLRLAWRVLCAPDAVLSPMQNGTSEREWNSPATFANIRRGSTANLEGEPPALSCGYAACPMRLQS